MKIFHANCIIVDFICRGTNDVLYAAMSTPEYSQILSKGFLNNNKLRHERLNHIPVQHINESAPYVEVLILIDIICPAGIREACAVQSWTRPACRGSASSFLSKRPVERLLTDDVRPFKEALIKDQDINWHLWMSIVVFPWPASSKQKVRLLSSEKYDDVYRILV